MARSLMGGNRLARLFVAYAAQADGTWPSFAIAWGDLGSWHFMLYYAVLGQTFSSFALSFLSLMAIWVILATLYSASANSLGLPVLLHTSWNAATNCLVIAGFHFTLDSQLFQALALWIVAALLWRRLRASAAIESGAIF